jgi:hypothetical protein
MDSCTLMFFYVHDVGGFEIRDLFFEGDPKIL